MTYTRSTCGEDSRKIDQHSTKKYIEMWEHRYDFFPTCESFLTLKLAVSLDYMDCFRHNGKSYLLPASKRSRQHRRRRPKQWRINPRSGDGDEAD
ncbi:hypothetical protein Golob_002782 [Gossypium lobatum]|uniref:Uncharacterized protein n=1 Tax=Gossypium lobatum TaxID=34289 RepID=A0A7J8N645_9ROSI|nr:hypothetical protein [Gossypium lobatum]